MNKGRILGFLAVLLLFAAPLDAQDYLIPRRIRITAGQGVPDMVPAILYARLASGIPLVVAGPEDVPHNRIRIELDDKLVITLSDRQGPVDEKTFPLSLLSDPPALSESFETLAAGWESWLELTAPDVSSELQVQKERAQAAVSFEEQLIKPFQIALWLPISLRQILTFQKSEDPRKEDASLLWQWPLSLDFAWFFSENIGVTSSFRFEYGNHISFASRRFAATGSIPLLADTSVLMLMPGLGVRFRTVGRFSAEFGITLFLGAVNVNANEATEVPYLEAGESAWVFYPVLSIEPMLVWSPTPNWAVKLRIIELNVGLFSDDDADFATDENTFIINYLQLGAAYRW